MKVLLSNMVSESKKKQSPRQQLLSSLMSETSGAAGEELATAFAKGQATKFRGLMEEVVDKMVKDCEKKKK